MTYAGSPLCAAVNELLNHIHDLAVEPSGLYDRAEALRRAHNSTLFDEAKSCELPDSRHERVFDAQCLKDEAGWCRNEYCRIHGALDAEDESLKWAADGEAAQHPKERW